jgi:protein-tyrosine sulfotransferase
MKNIYVAGMGRSGTTLLQNILNAHPDIIAPPETFLVLHLKTKYAYLKEWNDKIRQDFIEDVYTDRPFRLIWNIPKAKVISKFATTKEIKSFTEACNLVMSCYDSGLEKEEVKVICDKNPIYSLFIKDLLALNKQAKCIHVVRDPRGSLCSQIYSFNRKDALALGYHWSNLNRNLSDLEFQYPEKYFRLYYEDLIENTEDTINKLCEFMEVSFNENMLNYHKSLVPELNKKATVLKEIHKSLFSPINKKIAEKWKEKLTETQKKHIEFSTHSVAKALGYKFEKPNVNTLTKVKFSFSKLKIFILVSVLKLYFYLPIGCRKLVLSMRSYLGDYKYKN